MSLLPPDRCRQVRAELDRYLALRTSQDYRAYVECFGVLPTQEFNKIWASIEDEEVHSAVYFIVAPPGSGKTFLLLRLKEEFEKRAKGPVIYYPFFGDAEQLGGFVSNFETHAAEAVMDWVKKVLGRSVKYAGCPPDVVLGIASAMRVVLGRKVPLLVLLDEVPADAEKIEQLLRTVYNYGLDPYVVISLHTPKELDAVMSDSMARGGITRYRHVETIKQITLATGGDKEAEEFIERLSGGAIKPDGAVGRVAVEMLRRGFGIRSVLTFVLGASRRPLGGSILQSYEKILHDAVVAKLAAKLGMARAEHCRRAQRIASKPDFFFKDCTCVEVKVRSGDDEIPPQHACDKILYVVISPRPPPAPLPHVVHVQADVPRLLSGYDEVRKKLQAPEDAKLMELMAEVLSEVAVAKIRGTPPLPPDVEEICSTLSRIFGSRDSLSRYNLVKTPDFKRLMEKLANKSAAYKEKLLDCVKKPLAACVDDFAGAVREVYGAELLKLDGSTVYLICGDRRRQL
jgi:hypothetical protein